MRDKRESVNGERQPVRTCCVRSQAVDCLHYVPFHATLRRLPSTPGRHARHGDLDRSLSSRSRRIEAGAEGSERFPQEDVQSGSDLQTVGSLDARQAPTRGLHRRVLLSIVCVKT